MLAFVASGFNLGATFAVMGGMETLLTNLLTNSTGRTNYSGLQIFANTALSAGMGYITGSMGKITKIRGATIGRNSFISVWKSGLTKLVHKNATRISASVVLKGLFGAMIMRFRSTFISGLFSSAVDWIKRLDGDRSGVGYI